MKKILFILIACFALSTVNYATDGEVVKTETTNLIVNGDFLTDNIICDIECPDDDCFNGCLYSTYKTEYCVGAKCRDRTLYKCNICSSTWWIYHDE